MGIDAHDMNDIHFELLLDGLEPIRLATDTSSSIAEAVAAGCPCLGRAHQIPGELFSYTTRIDIPFDGMETETHEIGDVVYWRAAGGARRYGILVMHGATEYGDGNQPRSNGPAIRFARVLNGLEALRSAPDGLAMELRVARPT